METNFSPDVSTNIIIQGVHQHCFQVVAKRCPFFKFVLEFLPNFNRKYCCCFFSWNCCIFSNKKNNIFPLENRPISRSFQLHRRFHNQPLKTYQLVHWRLYSNYYTNFNFYRFQFRCWEKDTSYNNSLQNFRKFAIVPKHSQYFPISNNSLQNFQIFAMVPKNSQIRLPPIRALRLKEGVFLFC